jgi:hypothetical protein
VEEGYIKPYERGSNREYYIRDLSGNRSSGALLSTFSSK